MAEAATRQHAAEPAAEKVQRAAQPGPQQQAAGGEAAIAVLARPGTRFDDPLLDPRLSLVQRATIIRHLQRAHGNAYVQRLINRAAERKVDRAPCAGCGDDESVARVVVLPAPAGSLARASAIQREAVACPEPPAPAPPKAPEQDPRFRAVKGKVVAIGKTEKKHEPAKAKAVEAQAAAVSPPEEISSQASAAQVAEMGAKEPGAFDKAAFVAAVRAAIEKITPKSEDEAEEFKASGKAGQVKQEVAGLVTQGKEGAEKDIKDTAEAPPDPSKAEPKPVSPMQEETAGPPPGPVAAAAAMPSPKPAAELSLEHGPCQTDAKMAEAGVTEEQLEKSNEPEFKDALASKKEAETHAKTAPKEVRKEEQATLDQAKTEAKTTAATATSAMHESRAGALTTIQGGKEGAKGKDEAKRAEIAAKIEAIYNATKTDVTAILQGLDAKVNTAFETGEKAAREAFENYVDRRMREYKDRRSYVDAVVDFVAGLPPEVNAYYTEGRNLYLSQMDGVIDKIAGIVETELTKAKKRITQGKKEIATYVASLPKDLRKIGKEVQGEFEGKFEQLDQEVNAKQDELVQSLAQKYAEARDAVDARIAEMKEANKGLVDKAMDAVGGVIETIKNLKNMLMGVLAKAADAIDKIIADPIQFLSNLVGAIKQGLNQFVANIGKHLKDGLMGWLFGELAAAGITMPKALDFKGILDLVLQIMGLTYNAIRARAVKIVGEEVVKRIEQVAEVFKILITEGPAGLWKWIVDKVDNLVDTVLGGIKDLVITKVITAGITWLLSLLNPASAFVKACKMIYDVIMFFVERGSQIVSLVNAIIDSVSAIANGAIGAAANWVEQSLAKALPVAISFLASLLGLGGLSTHIRKIIEKVQAPVGKAVDAVINFVVKGFKKVGGFVKGLFGKGDKEKEAKQEQLPPSEGPIPPIPFSMAGASHALYIEESGGSVQVKMASRNKERVTGKFQAVRSLLDSYKSEISGIGDPAIKKDFEEQLVPFINELMEDHISSKVAEIEGKKTSKEREKVLAEIKPIADELVAEIVGWASKRGVQDMTPEAVEKRAEEAADQLWRQKQAEVQAALEAFVPQIEALAGDGRASLQYRGSLARGHKHGGKGFADFDPENFDVDAFIKSDALAAQARAAGAPVEGGKIWGSRSGIPALEKMVSDMRKALAKIGGMKKRNNDEADFDVVIRSEAEVLRLKQQPRAPGEEEKHVRIDAPAPPPAAPPAAAPAAPPTAPTPESPPPGSSEPEEK